MAKTTTQKAALNMITGAIVECVALVCGLILPRLVLANYGSAYNGITSSARQFLSATSILTLGVAGTTRVALYKTLSVNDIEGSSAIVRATEIYMRRVGIILAIYVVLLAIVYPLLVDTGYTWMEVAPLILAAGISSFGTYYFGTTYQAFLSADQSIYITNTFTIIATIVNTALSAMLISLHCTIQTVMLASSFVLFMKPLLQSVYVNKKYKLIRNCPPDTTALAKRKDVMAHSIANIVHDNTDIIVLTIFCNVKVVSVYTVYNLIMNALRKLQGVFTTGTEAIFGKMWVKHELGKIKKTLELYEYAVTFIISTVFSTTLVMILPFIAHYTKRVTDVEYILPQYALIITIAQMCFCMRAPYLTLVQGAGKYRETRNGAFVEAALNIFISVILVQFMGISGVAVGTLIANLFRTVQYAIYIDKHIIHRGMSVFLRKIIWASFNVAGVYFICISMANRFSFEGWYSWIIVGLCVFSISFVFTTLSSIAFYKEDLRRIWIIVKKQLMKRGTITRKTD